MECTKIKMTLSEMEGKQFKYGSRIHEVKSTTVDEAAEAFTIITDVDRYTRKFDNAEIFLSYWKKINDKAVADLPDRNGQQQQKDSILAKLVEAEQQSTLNLSTIITDNITKVQANKEYIAQAKIVNENIKSLIELSRVKIELLRLSCRSK